MGGGVPAATLFEISVRLSNVAADGSSRGSIRILCKSVVVQCLCILYLSGRDGVHRSQSRWDAAT